MKKLNQKGFGILEILLVILLVCLVGGIGYYVYSQALKNDTSNAPQSSVNTGYSNKQVAKGDKVSGNESAYVNVIQADDSIKEVTPGQIAKTDDQKGVLEAIHKSLCKAPDTNVVINHVTFTDGTNYRQVGDYAYINAGCIKPGTPRDSYGSGSATYLHKTGNTWAVDVHTQMGPICSDVDGKGYPSSLIKDCYDTDNSSRAPK